MSLHGFLMTLHLPTGVGCLCVVVYVCVCKDEDGFSDDKTTITNIQRAFDDFYFTDNLSLLMSRTLFL